MIFSYHVFGLFQGKHIFRWTEEFRAIFPRSTTPLFHRDVNLGQFTLMLEDAAKL